MMRVVHYEVILTRIDAPRRSQRPSIPDQHCKASSGSPLGPRGCLRGEPWIGPGDWQSQVNQRKTKRGHNARGGYNKAPAHVDGIGCPATGGTSLGSPWPPFYLFVSSGDGDGTRNSLELKKS